MKKIIAFVFSGFFLLSACSNGIPDAGKKVDSYPAIFPDYKEVTIPTNIAPLNFGMEDKDIKDAWAFLTAENESLQTKLERGTFHLDAEKWKKLLQAAAGKSIHVEISVKSQAGWVVYKPFEIFVSRDSMDEYIAYRRIAPGYELWKNLGIY